MNELAAGKTMTVREVADVLGVSPDTVYNSAKELFPDLFSSGKTTYLNEKQVTAVKMNLRKNSEVALQPKTDLEKTLTVEAMKQAHGGGKGGGTFHNVIEGIETRMTTAEVCQTLGCDKATLLRNWREIETVAAPATVKKIEHGKPAYWSEAELTLLLEKMKGNANNQHTLQENLQGIETSQSRAFRIELLHKQIEAELQAEIAELQAKAESDRPKVEFFEQVADCADALQMRDVAGVLNIQGWGRNKLFEFLREKDVLDDRNIPYREYQDRGFFRVIEQKWTDKEGETHINLKTLVYQRGVDFIRKMIREAA